MNFRTTYTLFGLLGVMLVVLGVVLWRGGTPRDEKHLFPSAKGKDEIVPTDDITKVVIQRKRPALKEIVFERGSDREWRITAPRQLAADSGTITSMVQAITSARVEEKERPKSIKDTGLDAPSRIIRLIGKDRELTLTIGDTTPGEESSVVYVMSSDRPKEPLAVRKRTLEGALEDVHYFRSRTLLGENTSDITGIQLTRGKKDAVELKKVDDRWRLVRPPYGDADIGTLLNNIGDLRLSPGSGESSDFVKDGVTNLAEYHLDPAKNDVLRIEVTRLLRADLPRGDAKKPQKKALLIGVGKAIPAPAEKKPAGLGDEKKSYYYAAVDDGGKMKDVVRLEVKNVEPILKAIEDPGAMRNKSLVQLDGIKRPDALDVRNTYGLLEFRPSEQGMPRRPAFPGMPPDMSAQWQLYRSGKAAATDTKEVEQLLNTLTTAKVLSFVERSKRAELGLEKPDKELDAVVKVYVDALEKPDPKAKGMPALKKDAKPAAVLRFGIKVGDEVAVERVWGDTKEGSVIVMVPAALKDLVLRGPLAYFDKGLPSFNPPPFPADENVTKVELTRPGERLVVEREKATGEKWKVMRIDPKTDKPDPKTARPANTDAVLTILNEVNRQLAREVVAEKATETQLAKTYELAKPAYRVEVTLTKDKKPTTHTFSYGKVVEGKGVYLKLGDKDAVYLVGPAVLDTLKRDLRDPKVFTFEPSAVVSLTLKGWDDGLGERTLALEQKGGKWTAKAPKGFKLDEKKVAQFVLVLSQLQAEKFVPSGKEMTTKQGALRIEVTLIDKKVLDLTIGGDEGKGFFATSNQLKGEVFVVDKAAFEAAKKAPRYFEGS